MNHLTHIGMIQCIKVKMRYESNTLSVFNATLVHEYSS